MPLIQLETVIDAPPPIVFDLSRSVDLHKASMTRHREEAIGGVQRGLMKKGDTVLWQARHLLKKRTLKVAITDMKPPAFFTDEMLEGDFKRMQHRHLFKPIDGGTLMIDQFYFESPFGVVGKIVNRLFLTAYMRRLLVQRNKEIKRIAESDARKQFLT